ncbi:AraC family transcriptional regulator [Pantoea endophytica]|uniref:AraC family transcriptional regulator n=1 Tax=Pantoea endophytica TaxID=92488 RepID=UPI001AE76753|nr:AraC family transcriptional regulator [Pantoea endophytica]
MLKRETFRYDLSTSWFSKHLQLSEIPFKWHYHQEYELTLTLHSTGKRYIGNHASSYSSPDLVFIAPNQPHSWESPQSDVISEIFVIMIPETWFNRQLMSGMEEYRTISQLFSCALPAIHFSTECAKNSEALFRKITVCESPLERLSYLIMLFEILIKDKELEHISDRNLSLPIKNQRVDKILNYIDTHFSSPLTLQQVADFSHCSISAVKRDLATFVGLSFSQYIVKLRINRACFLLRTTSLPLSVIASQCGFQEVSYFHKKFNCIMRCTPAKFRKNPV